MIETLEAVADNIGEAMLRREAEEKLIASERFLRMLTNQLPGMVGYWDTELRCRFANTSYVEWFGKTPEQMLGIPQMLLNITACSMLELTSSTSLFLSLAWQPKSGKC